MSTATVSRWARRFLVASGLFLVASQVAVLGGAPRQVEVVLGLQGFVLTAVFGKAYSLVPSYFDRSLAWPRALPVHLTLAVVGVSALAAGLAGLGPDGLLAVGAVAWCLGVATFVGTLLATVRDNLTGAETATGESETDRRRVDRFANAFVPVALAYLVVGSYELLAWSLGSPSFVGGGYAGVAHLLAAGFALLLLFAVGYRLLPRFLSVPTPGRFAAVVLPLGAVGPALLAWGLPAGQAMQAGAAVEATAVAVFALSYLLLVGRTDRSRVGFYGPLAGVCLGLVGVGLGAWFAVEGPRFPLTAAHLRVNVFGLLGTTIVGVVYQFYPPAIGQWPFAGDRLALATIAGLTLGVALSAIGPSASKVVETVGAAVTALAATGYLYLLVGAMRRGTSRR